MVRTTPDGEVATETVPKGRLRSRYKRPPPTLKRIRMFPTRRAASAA
jgi:hypothetical protein